MCRCWGAGIKHTDTLPRSCWRRVVLGGETGSLEPEEDWGLGGGTRGTQTSGLETQQEGDSAPPLEGAGGWGGDRSGRGLHARALGAVAVGAPVGRLAAALACDPTPHFHGDACLRAPPDGAAQLLGGPFCDPPEAQKGNKVRSLKRLLRVLPKSPPSRGRDGQGSAELGQSRSASRPHPCQAA